MFCRNNYKKLWEIKVERERLYDLNEMSEKESLLVADLEVEFAELGGYNAESDANKLLISGEDRMDVVAKIKEQTLKIRHSLEHIFNPTFTYVELYHTGLLDEISLYQGANLKADSIYRQTSISLKVQEGSSMNFKFEGEKLASTVSTGGKLFLSGKSTAHRLSVSSGGACEAELFQSEQTKVNVTAGGMAYVYASKLLEAKVTAGGIIRTYGNPIKVVTKKAIGGQIFEMK